MPKRLLPALLACLLLTAGCGRISAPPSAAASAPTLHTATQVPVPAPAPALFTVAAGGEALALTAGAEPVAVTVTDAAALPVPDPPETDGELQITRGYETVFQGPLAQADGFLPGQNGSYLYTYLTDQGRFSLLVTLQLPPAVTLSAPGAGLGEWIVLQASFLEEGAAPTAVTELGFTPVFFATETGYQALLPIPYGTVPGSYALTVTAGGADFPFLLTVSDRDFEVQYLTVDAGTTAATVNSDTANAEWNQKIEPLKALSDPAQHWSGPFLQPVAGEITTEFGMIRYTNGSSYASRHGGIDIAAAAGTPVAAAGTGRVLFADFLQLTGNTVVIEHGMGLKSWYYHMDSLTIAADEMVAAGDQIGTVGSTGFSTGPHLHFALSVNRVFVNPWTAFDRGILPTDVSDDAASLPG